LGEKASISSTQVSLAALALEQNHGAQAESLSRQAIQEFQVEKLPNQEAGARDVLAQVLVAQNKPDAANAEITAVKALGATDPPTVLSLAITGARVSAAKNAPAALQKLQAAIQRAKEMGAPSYQLQARLAVGEIQTATDAKGKENARPGLESLIRDAQQSNYKLIARKAQELLSAKPRR
jgi:hypothetical protein